MNLTPVLLLVCVALSLARPQAFGQDAGTGVKVSTLLRKDGTKEVTTTDSDNHSSETSTFAQGEKLLKRVVYTLDEQSLPLQGIVYDARGRMLYKSLYTRDAAGRVAEEAEFSSDGRSLGRFVYHYGANGTLAKIDAYDASGNLVSQSGVPVAGRQSLPRKHH